MTNNKIAVTVLKQNNVFVAGQNGVLVASISYPEGFKGKLDRSIKLQKVGADTAMLPVDFFDKFEIVVENSAANNASHNLHFGVAQATDGIMNDNIADGSSFAKTVDTITIAFTAKQDIKDSDLCFVISVNEGQHIAAPAVMLATPNKVEEPNKAEETKKAEEPVGEKHEESHAVSDSASVAHEAHADGAEAQPEIISVVQELDFKIVTVETALLNYEKTVKSISNQDIASIEQLGKTVVQAQSVAENAINALPNGAFKDSMNLRFKAAQDNQQQAYKELYLYLSKDNTLSLFKVNNVGGIVPFNIIYKDDIILGKATEAFYFAPNSNSTVNIIAQMTPAQRNIPFGGRNTKIGAYIYIFKIADKYYRTIITATEKSIAKINDIVIPQESIAQEGHAYVVPSEIVNKAELVKLFAKANADYQAHHEGSAAGQVAKAARDKFKAVIDAVGVIIDNADAQKDEVAKAVSDLTKAEQEFDTFIVKYYVDETNLQKAVDIAKRKLATAKVGDKVGETTQANIDAYRKIVDMVQKVLDDTPSHVDYSDAALYEKYVKAVNDALVKLTAATDAFVEGIVTSASYAEEKVKLYEDAAKAFIDGIRKKINI